MRRIGGMKKLFTVLVGLAVIAVAALVKPVEKPSAIEYGSVETVRHQMWAVKEQPGRTWCVEQAELVPVHALAVTQWNGVGKRITD